ncbi:Six-bladed beta-propeller [Quillaja saponaria]|uniref:Six-bladed beta-propeller n=1 Tax=Quillaja saponaria TaxID=32244 RepID=A0AAD7LA19_QUISA|nr:Six-bladed beta-propeller [Quillaja saponaria]
MSMSSTKTIIYLFLIITLATIPIPVDRDTQCSLCWLNGIAYVSKGYFLAVQSNTAKMFRVDVDDGRRDSWGEGVVYVEIDLNAERFATAVAVGEGKVERDNFGIEEVRSEKESGEENV